MSIRGGPDIIEDGLVLHLDAADPNSYRSSTSIYNLVTDIGGYAYLHGNTTYGNISGGTMNISSAGGVNTNDGCVVLGTTGSFNIGNTVNNGNDFTTCGWLYKTRYNGAEVLHYRHNSFRLCFEAADSAMIFYQRETVAPYTTRSVSVVTTNNLNRWYFYVLSRTGTTFSFYKDGVFIGSQTFSLTETQSSTNFSIGYAWTDDDYTSNTMHGSIGPISHYTKALSADEILQNYNATKGRYGL